jgi:uncharacterized protein YbaR (Trm112 family)
MMEFPLANGLWNRLRVRTSAAEEADPESWCVRYYTVQELQTLFEETFGNFCYANHCYFGIGLQSVDLHFVPWRFKPVILASLALNRASTVMPVLKRLSDSIYVCAKKSNGSQSESIKTAQEPSIQSLRFLQMLRCPVSGETLRVAKEGRELLSDGAGLTYPVYEGVPILLPPEARHL